MSSIGGPEFVRVPIFDNDHSVTEINRYFIPDRSFLILWPSQSAQLAKDKDDVSGETINLKLAVDFENVAYI
jgi:hypothetical protein